MTGESREQRNERYETWLVEHRSLVYALCGVVFAVGLVMIFVLTWSDQDSPLYRLPTYALIGASAAVVVQTRKATKNRLGG
jgi:hypothetical protein